MKVCLLFNPKAGSASQIDALRKALEARYRLTVVETHDADDLTAKARQAARGRYGLIAVAGGDGTLHRVINALGPRYPRIPLAFLPLGTGNDLCRTLAIPLDPVEAARTLHRHRWRALDVVRVEGCGSQFMMNAATGGFSGRVAADVTDEIKQFWGPLAYLRGAAGPIAERESYRVTIRFDDGEPQTFDALNLVVANGRTAAGGISVAPLANPEDGLLDVVIVCLSDLLDLSVIAASLMAGDYLQNEQVIHRRAKRVEIVSDPPMPLSVDGEHTESSRLSFEVLPKAVRVIPGRDYRPDPASAPAGPGGPIRYLFAAVAAILWVLSRSTRWPGLGITFAILIFAVFAWLTYGVMENAWSAFNQDVARSVRAQSHPALDCAMLAVTRLGDPVAAAAIGLFGGALFTVWRRYASAVGLMAVLIGLAGLELVLKPWLALDRPDLLPHLVMAHGFGYPSGHALRGIGLSGFFAALLLAEGPRSAWRWGLALLLIFTGLSVAMSRIYLGVHSATDVLAGGLLATGWVCVCLAIASSFRRELTASERRRG